MINISYKVSSEQWLQGWEKYYDTFKFKGQVIRAAIFLVPLILFVEQVIKDPSYGAGWICIIICLLSMAVLLLSKFTDKRNYQRLLQLSVDEEYAIMIEGSELTLITMEPKQEKTEETEEDRVFDTETFEESLDAGIMTVAPMKYDIGDKYAKAYESDEFFGIFSDGLNCVIPKSELSEEDASSLREALKKAMDKRFTLC